MIGRIRGTLADKQPPEILVDEVMEALKQHFHIVLEEVTSKKENVTFKMPAALLKEAS